MLFLLDERTAATTQLRPARSGLVTICAHPPEGAGGPDASGLRVLLVTDLIVRSAELAGLQAFTMVTRGSQPSSNANSGWPTADALGIHPPTATGDSHDSETPLDGRADIHVTCQPIDATDGIISHVGHVHTRVIRAVGATPSEHDPLAVRLALMCVPHHEPVDLTSEFLTTADQALRHWRAQVAQWAEAPSQPMPKDIATEIQASFASISTVPLLSLLKMVAADPQVPAGARFETFAYADRVLGLDLARAIGQPPS